jgi:hypothetical protein
MSPTMTEGGIAGWKKKEGETFTAGDVLLEIVRDHSYFGSGIARNGEIVVEGSNELQRGSRYVTWVWI